MSPPCRQQVGNTTSTAHSRSLSRNRRTLPVTPLVRDGKWFLVATCELPEPAPNTKPEGFLGVDLGIVNIATSSDGVRYGGAQLNRMRHRNRRLRAKLQAKKTKSAKRLLKKRRRREALHAKDVNHCISKQIVAEAQRSGRGIALEQLKGIRGRVKARKPQRATLHSWAFAQLGDYLAYKARRVGVPVQYVDPRYTSQECSSCGTIDKHSRKDQASFERTRCGFAEHADRNAAQNIASRGEAGWAAVKRPHADNALAA